MDYKDLKIGAEQASDIALGKYGISGKATVLPGEVDFNFKIAASTSGNFILKVSRPDADMDYLDFQQKLLKHLESKDVKMQFPQVVDDLEGNTISTVLDKTGTQRVLRMLTWIDGRVCSMVNPKTGALRHSLGVQCGRLTQALIDFDHPGAHRSFEWDIAQSLWTKQHLDLFQPDEKEILIFFQQRFEAVQETYSLLRKSVVHNDANDNNVIVSDDLKHPRVKAVIDFGDAVYTQILNDLAVACTYAIMNHDNPLEAALPVVQGYHKAFPVFEEEIAHLYDAIAMRLVVSVTKSAINKIREPDNSYLLISEKPAWEVLKKWYLISPDFAHYSFRKACGFQPHPNEAAFNHWAKSNSFELSRLFPTVDRQKVLPLDLSVSSRWLGHLQDFENLPFFGFRIKQLLGEHPTCIPAGGYLEPRAFYTTPDYDRIGDHGKESRTIHLGVDFWLREGTAVHSLLDGEVVLSENDTGYKGYGGLVVLKHHTKDFEFYTLYGHLSVQSVIGLKLGQKLKRGDRIGCLGNINENGNWSPHLHFQVMLSLLGNQGHFPGVAYHRESDIWKSICPDPNKLFKLEGLLSAETISNEELVRKRKRHLGKSLSLSYKVPIRMVRGDGQYLMDQFGGKYLDTVNNVAHVGHEHPDVVKTGQEQMALLNTNSRYLHENILELAKELLETLPKELSVLHFVNSGTEANELAIRMVKAATGQKDIIASEAGYHGNSNMCIDISSYKFDGKGGHKAPEHTHIFPLPDAFRGKYRGNDTGGRYAKEVKKLIDGVHKKGRGVGALIVEPIISCGGQIELPQGFLSKAYGYIRNAGGLCVSDEVQVGCGRPGSTFWGFQLYDVVPDIVTIGKPLGNGHPLAAVACTPAVAEKFANGMEYFNTFGGNPVSCAIGTAVLKTVKREKLQENALTVGNFLKMELQKLAEKFPIIGDVRGQGLFLGFELVDADLNPLASQTDYLIDRMKDHGILMSSDGPDRNVLKIKPPMVFTQANAEELVFYLEKILSEDFMQLR
ncbi:MAG: peptidase M23 [Muricauda sp.]|nr:MULTISPECIES: aminotransferase class III-fold pyridoxal phosphate-dependent enzyme [unclassified Allomuricauda]MAU15157.1 peptidase M23 [Allomuricauda sp.]|tara:strand:+ start:2153 stop:5182 length:3030 start_codon:yes stop_codon:yes gene_type:complete